MATIHATLDQPLKPTGDAIQQAATAQGWAFDPRASGINLLVFTRSVSAFSWGSTLRVALAPGSDTKTLMTLTTSEVFALTDWGRGKRAIERLLVAVGAQRA